MRKKTRRRPELCLALAVLLTGCATTQLPSVKVDVLQPEEASRHSVAVLSDTYMQDFDLADQLRESFRQECVRCGFDVKSAEYDADLVIVPSMTVSSASQASVMPSRSILRKPHLFDTTRDSLGRVDMPRVSASPLVSAPRLVLVVSAFRRQDWFDPQFIDAPMPKAWRITAAVPRREGQEMAQLPELVAACGKSLDQFAAKN